jgi:hypothetical protein
MADQEVVDRLARLEATINQMHTILVRLEWRLEEAGLFPGNTYYGNVEERYALENNFQLNRTGNEGEPTTEEDISRVLDWLRKHEDQKEIGYYQLEEDFLGLKNKLKRILQFLHMRGQYESTIERLSKSFGGSAWIARDPYKEERKPRKP